MHIESNLAQWEKDRTVRRAGKSLEELSVFDVGSFFLQDRIAEKQKEDKDRKKKLQDMIEQEERERQARTEQRRKEREVRRAQEEAEEAERVKARELRAAQRKNELEEQ